MRGIVLSIEEATDQHVEDLFSDINGWSQSTWASTLGEHTQFNFTYVDQEFYIGTLTAVPLAAVSYFSDRRSAV